MRRVVLDTNVLVSALLSPGSTASRVLHYIGTGDIVPCYDDRILAEYRAVLSRDKLKINPADREVILSTVRKRGEYVFASPIFDTLPDESDRPFLEVARQVDATVVTGNLKHFPSSPKVCNPNGMLAHLSSVVYASINGDEIHLLPVGEICGEVDETIVLKLIEEGVSTADLMPRLREMREGLKGDALSVRPSRSTRSGEEAAATAVANRTAASATNAR